VKIENIERRDKRDVAINASDAICNAAHDAESATKNAAQHVAPRSLILLAYETST
jgi:hypothetical protein